MRKTDGASLRDDQQAVAATGVKALVPIDRPFLDYVLTALADAGYRQICLVVGPEHEVLREYYGRTLSYQRRSVDFALQVEPKGTADAVAAIHRRLTASPCTRGASAPANTGVLPNATIVPMATPVRPTPPKKNGW